ncbi:MAG: HAD hydrolase-like protein [Deltaproteobacteria bacterium]|nr:HAD hydrolase-like protein [Deltaproteobacteria bacterium]
MGQHTIFFDLDGTLIDSKPGVTKSFSRALRDFGIDASPDSLQKVIGPPLGDSFRSFGLQDDTVNDAVAQFTRYYKADGIFDLSVYEGVPEMLQTLRGAGKRLFLATSKQEDSAIRILEHFGLAPCFAGITGASTALNRLTKTDVLRCACERYGVDAGAGCVMAGDREHDVHGAHDVGMPCIGVLYGYGTRRELEEAGADALAPSVADLETRLLA